MDLIFGDFFLTLNLNNTKIISYTFNCNSLNNRRVIPFLTVSNSIPLEFMEILNMLLFLSLMKTLDWYSRRVLDLARS